jgi:hypothetical protein
MAVKKHLMNLLTGKDNQTLDVGRVALAASVAVFLALAIYSVVVLHDHWDPQAFGIGIASVLGGGGAGLALKAKTEPDPPAPAAGGEQ